MHHDRAIPSPALTEVPAAGKTFPMGEGDSALVEPSPADAPSSSSLRSGLNITRIDFGASNRDASCVVDDTTLVVPPMFALLTILSSGGVR